uniref:Uncharacterized protein n=1 Tax=Felis catus TaxID=9685 RepID=A0ABI7VXK0_FELCA
SPRVITRTSPSLQGSRALFTEYYIYVNCQRQSGPNLRTDEYEKGRDHLTNALAVCGQPQQLLIASAQSLAEDDVECETKVNIIISIKNTFGTAEWLSRLSIQLWLRS